MIKNPLVETTVYIGVSEALKYLKSLPAQLAICTQKAQNPGTDNSFWIGFGTIL